MNNKKVNLGKKGISAIVATVLIILITVAAVTIVWVAIIPMVGDQLESGTICLDAVTQLQLADEGYNCVGANGDNVSFQIKRGSKSFDLIDVQILISVAGSTESFNLVDATTLYPDPMTVDKLPNANEKRDFILDTSSVVDGADIDGITIAPIVVVGNTEKTCDPSSSMVLKEC